MNEPQMSYNNTIVSKPWGHEYLVYENDDVALWFLHIKKGESTSMHCHPKKTTGLILLDGNAEISFLADSRVLQSLDKVMIRRGLFHSTKALTDNGAFIFEVETPKDKDDLVRLNDRYGRASKPYEDEKHQNPKNENCLWITDPKSEKSEEYSFSNCKLFLEKINDISIINNKHDDDLIVFLKGGMVRRIDGKEHCVTMSGDVGKASIIKKVSHQLEGVVPDTIIMTISKNEK